MNAPELVSDFGAATAAEVGLAGHEAATAPPAPRPGTTRILLWDLPLRVFHWSLVASVTAAVVTGEIGGSLMVWHGRAGLLIVGLLVFRIVWGVVGSVTARFTSFAPSPGRVLKYLRGQWRGVGHNPLGALSVFALIGLLSLQGATGLFGNDDIAFAGPLNHLIDDTLGARVTGWHKLLADGLFVLMGLHVAAILFHVFVRRHNLVRPMVTGVEDMPHGTELPSTAPSRRGGAVALVGSVTLAAAAVLALVWAGSEPAPAQVGEPDPPAPAVSAPSW